MTMTELLASAGEILTWIMSILSTMMTTIMETPILLAFVLIGLTATGIFLAIKVVRKLGLRRR